MATISITVPPQLYRGVHRRFRHSVLRTATLTLLMTFWAAIGGVGAHTVGAMLGWWSA